MKKFLPLIFLFASSAAVAQIVDAEPESQVVCGGTGAALTATVTPPGSGGSPGSLPTTSYAITGVTYSPDPLTSGTLVSLTDDSQTGLLPIGFNFCFYGNQYSQFIIGSNNWIGFQTGETSTWVTTSIPNSSGSAPRNVIMGPWQDINPGVGGSVRYAVYGTAPFRRLSVSWNTVPMFSCTGQLYSSQIIIYESTNVIETHILNKSLCTTWNSGNAVHGLHNATGTLATVVPGRNNTQWVASNEGTRFTPNGTATYTINWYSLPTNTFLGSGASITVFPTTSPFYVYAEVSGPSGCGTGGPNRDTVQIISSSLFVDAGPYTQICEGTSTLLNAVAPGAVTFNWSPATGLSNPSIANPFAAPTTTTTYTVTAVDGVGCTGTDTVTVYVHPAPFVDAGSGAGICAGDNIQLSGSGFGTFSWSPAGSLDDPTIAAPTASPVVTTTYTLTITDAIGCSASDTATVFILNPNASAGSDVGICLGSSTTLSATGGTSYVWSPGTGLSSTVIQNPVANPTVTTTYTVTATDAMSGCSATDAVTVTVNPLPVADAGAFTMICAGASTTLNGSGGTTYSWSPTTGLSDPNISNPIATPSATTLYTLSVVDAAGCTDTDTVTVQVNPIPLVDAGANVDICAGSSTTLMATGAATYVWSPATGLSDPTIANPVASPASPTTYTVTGTSSYGCTATDTVRIDLNGIVITVSPSVAICQGASTTISASGGASTYTWSPATGLSNPNIASPVATPSVTTVYTVIGTSPDGCADTNSVTVTVNPLPPVNAGPTALVCAGSTTTLSGSGASSYSWSPGTFLSSTNIPNPVVSPTTTITYTLTGTDLNGCVNSDTVSVIVLPVPTASAGSNTSICQGQSTVLAGSGGGTYSWGPTTGLSNPLIANPVATPTSTTTYTVTVTGSNGCTSPAQVTITVNPAPIATATASDFNICLGASTNLSAAGGVAYSWSPTAGLSDPNIANPTAMPGSSTMYIVTVSSSVGCTDTASVFITVNNTMSIGASTVTPETCGESNGVIVTGAITGGGAPYTYSINGGPAQSSNTFTGLLAGSYTITVTDNAGCSTTQVVNVGQVLGVNAAFTANPPSGASPLTVNFSNGSTGASNYIWDFGDGGNSLLNNPSNIYGTNGTYTVTLVAYNGSLACSDTATMTILVYDDVIITAPNIFTPNGDQTNDVFVIQSVGLKTLEGKMFNRWGREVGSWNGTGPNDGWDGKINGNTAEDGTYFFIINATGYDGKTYEEKGYVQVLGGK